MYSDFLTESMDLTRVFHLFFRTESEIRSFTQTKGVDGVVPWYVTYNDEPRFHTAFVARGKEVTALTMSPESGEFVEIETLKLENSSSVSSSGPWMTDILFFSEDAMRGREFMERVANSIRSNFDFRITPPGRKASEEIKSRRDRCQCDSVNDDIVEKEQTDDGPYKTFRCQNCTKIHGIELDGKKITPRKLFDADWALEDFRGDIVEIDEENDYLIKTDGKHPRIVGALHLLSDASMEESEYSGAFDPNDQMALLYIADGRIAGFLSWNEPVQFQVLRQLYVQPEARRRGFAETLVRRWIERYCRNDVYFLDQPNDSSRSLFARLDDELASSGPTSREYFALQPVNLEY